MSSIQALTFLVGTTGAGCAFVLTLALAALVAERREAAKQGGYALRVWRRDAATAAAAAIGLAAVVVAWALIMI